jgi:hypothetical protein
MIYMKKEITLLALVITSLVGCRREPDTAALSNSFVVQSSRTQGIDFGAYKTFYIPDSIAIKTTNPNDSLWFDASAQQLITTVKQNMTSRGYTLVPKGSNPDIGLSFFAVKDLNVGVIYPGWWYGWGYWGGCYWGYCGYPPYYGYGGVIYSIPTGTLILDMIDLENASQDEQLGVIWGSVMSGGLGNTGNDLELGVEAINQAFTQSPYIKTN